MLGWQLASSQPIPSMGAMDSSLLIWSYIVSPPHIGPQPPTYIFSFLLSPVLHLLTTALMGFIYRGVHRRLARKQYGTAPRPEAAVDYITRCHRFKFRLLLNL